MEKSKGQSADDLAAHVSSQLAASRKGLLFARIYLARHCKTQWNLEGKLQGKTELPLCETGRQEARQAASSLRSLGIHRIVTSPAARAHETGKIFAEALGVPIEISLLLRELDHGHWEGKSFEGLKADISSDFAQWLTAPASLEEIPGSCENTVAAQQRMAQGICEIASKYRNQTVLVIAHKHLNALFMCRLLKKPMSAFASLIEESIAPRLLPSDFLAELCGDV